jgi:hypothetical protein
MRGGLARPRTPTHRCYRPRRERLLIGSRPGSLSAWVGSVEDGGLGRVLRGLGRVLRGLGRVLRGLGRQGSSSARRQGITAAARPRRVAGALSPADKILAAHSWRPASGPV